MAKGTVTVRLPEELLESFKVEAQAKETTMSQVIIDAIMLGRKIDDREDQVDPQSEAAPAPVNEVSATESVTAEVSEQDRPVTLEDLAERVFSLESYLIGNNMALGDLTLRVTRAAAAAEFYSRIAAFISMDMSTFLVTQEIPDEETKKWKLYEMKQKCRKFQQDILGLPYEQMINI